MSSDQPRLDFEAPETPAPPASRDEQARRLAVDPSRNVALEASAGTGKTRVLVDRYVGLLAAGVEPRHILAITFTRKAAAEMRQRILETLAARRDAGAFTSERWRAIRDRLGDIAISTIDAFCLALLHEFPLEADVDPDFDLADETEAPRLVDLALDRTLRAGRALAADDEGIALVFADLGEYRLREGLARLIDRRLVARGALARFAGGARVDVETSVAAFVDGLRAAVEAEPGGVEGFLACGPDDESYGAFARDLRWLSTHRAPRPAELQARLGRVRGYLLTQKGEPRRRLEHRKALFRSAADYERHKAAVLAIGPRLADLLERYQRDVNLVLARAVERLFAIALDAYRTTLVKQNLLDFPEVLSRTLRLLRQMDEFSRSRFRLESRYQHVLVDEFQDTSRAQWELVELLVRAWGEGEGVTSGPFPPSIFIVGDRKQSIYGFRDAEVEVLESAARYIQALRPGGRVRHAITRSFRSVRELLAFVNDAFASVDKQPSRDDAFRYGDDDAFPLAGAESSGGEAVGLVAAASDEEQAEAVAEEIARLILDGAVVRDRRTGVRRAVRPGDIALLFRTRESHRFFERALARRFIPFYVYKGLGFFDADEIKDVLALMACLATPDSHLRAAAFLRSRFVGLSDPALTALAPDVASALTSPDELPAVQGLAPDDRARLRLARGSMREWLALVDRLPPAELVDRILAESAYMTEIAGAGAPQARENLKKVRGLLRRLQNRGYATLGRVVEHFSRRTAGGDESNAIVDAEDAVSLMTVHAAKGLEFPVVVVANLARGSGGALDPIRVVPARLRDGEAGEPAVAIGDRQGPADRDAEAREAEETKRLLYVAFTRARDRLYLATTLDRAGRFAPAKGSLGRVMSADLGALIAGIASAGEADEGREACDWVGPSAVHRLRIVRPPAGEPRALPRTTPEREAVDDFAPLPPATPRRVPATAIAGEARADAQAGAHTGADADTAGAHTGADADAVGADVDASAPANAGVETASSRLVGLLVHRALEARVGLRPGARDGDGNGGGHGDGDSDGDGDGDAVLAGAFALLLRDDERYAVDADAVVDRARRLYRRVLARDDLRALFTSGRVEHEVAFSIRRGGVMVRGAIDCLVQVPGEDRVIVVEIKTGRPMPRHEAQLAVYVDAARALFPGSRVDGRLVYPLDPHNP